MIQLNKIDTKNCIGKIFNSKNSGKFEIIEYNNSNDVTIKFIDTGYITKTQVPNISSGVIKDKYIPSILEIGIVGNKYPTTINYKSTKEYQIWNSILNRCYNPKIHNIKPTYSNCSISTTFKFYESFYEWCQQQIGFHNQDWELDKDLLIKNNKVYSENTCVFLPQEINTFLTKRGNNRGNYPIGVSFDSNSKKFKAQISKGSKKIHLGLFNTPKQAYLIYKNAKEDYCKELANKYKSDLDPRAYTALINYRVDDYD